LVAHRDIDVVMIAVKVPHHRKLVTAEIAAGKQVYCECPLGNGLAEAIELADLARRGNIHTVIGLQGRTAPANQPSTERLCRLRYGCYSSSNAECNPGRSDRSVAVEKFNCSGRTKFLRLSLLKLIGCR
jgi:Oxidoreductase family, NAD-binding Rossmann fold